MLKPLVEIMRQPDAGNANHILGHGAVSETGEPIGHVRDYVFDEAGKLRYLVIDTGFWIFGKKVLFPVGLAKVREGSGDVVLQGLSREQAEKLPNYVPGESISDADEERIFSEFFPDRRGKVSYQDMEAFNTPIRMELLEERLFLDKHAEKIGDVKIRKVVETHIETIEVPVTVERLIVEPSETVEIVTGRGRPARHRGDRRPVSVEEESVTIQAYREVIDISKRKVVAEEVTIRKVAETCLQTVEEQLQREELYIDHPVQQGDLPARR